MATEEKNKTNLTRAQNAAGRLAGIGSVGTVAQAAREGDVSTLAKEGTKTAIKVGLRATAPYWVPVVATVALVMALILFIVVVAVAVLPGSAEAQKPSDYCKFGFFEVLRKGECIDRYTGTEGFVQTISFVIQLVLGLAVGLGLIMIVIGGYVYMTAGGNAQRVGTAKTMISAALLGIILAIAASLILNTISPQFSGDIRLPFK